MEPAPEKASLSPVLPAPPDAGRAPLLSVVVPCMGRLHHLRQTAPPLLAQPEVEYILVDYSCPDCCGDYARAHWPRAKVVAVPGETYFNKGRALNAGIRAATGRWLANIDADNVVGRDFARLVLSLAAEDVLVVHRADNWGTGFFACSRRVFALTGGHNERFEGWGGMDMELRQRQLALGLKLRPVPDGLIQVIDHDDAERTRFYPEKNKTVSDRRQRRLMRFRPLQEQRRPWLDPVTFGVPGPGPLQAWKTVQYAHYVRRLLGHDVRLYPYWHDGKAGGPPQEDYSDLMRQIDGLLAGDGPLELTVELDGAEVSRYNYGREWHFPLTQARRRWQGWTGGARRRIAYHFEGSNAGAPANRFDSLARLLSFARNHDLIELQLSWPLQRAAAVAAGCDLYVGLDSIFTHLCYAVGVPVVLLTAGQPRRELLRWHGDQPGIWCDELDDFLRLAEYFLGTARGEPQPVVAGREAVRDTGAYG